MSKPDIMCGYSGQVRHDCGAAKKRYVIPKKYFSKKVKCPECGRKLVPKVVLDQDGTCVLLYLRRHKTKKWWKVGKPRKVRK